MRPNLHWPERASPADLAECRAAIRTGSRSFYLASLLLPERIRSGAYALYAFCRLSDDSVDVAGGGAAAIARLAARLDAVFAGQPADAPVDRALADAVERYAIPRACFDALLEGFAWDVDGRQYATLDDLIAYATRVAGSVGAMMAALMGVREPSMAARACDLGIAMQLTNIARDVGEDASTGRLYLPRAWLAEAGIDADAWLAAPRFEARLAGVVQRLLACAAMLYRRADSAIATLPGDMRPAIRAARLLYAEIGAEIARHGYDSVSRRSVAPMPRKLALAALALAPSRSSADAVRQAPPLPQTQFLIDAVAAATPRAAFREGGFGWSLALFAALDQRTRRMI